MVNPKKSNDCQLEKVLIMKLIRILYLMFILLLTLGLNSACDDLNSDNQNISNLMSNLSTETVMLIDEEGQSKYQIIFPENSYMNEFDYAIKVSKQSKSNLGVTIKNSDDSFDGTDKFEILIGNTNRTESAVAKEILNEKTGSRFHDYIICTIGKKIVINAISNEGLSNAVDAFCSEFLKKVK